jgi:muramoyltetrapeptide carboxypeptidase LdcA involved in peptidoglycan recycling
VLGGPFGHEERNLTVPLGVPAGLVADGPGVGLRLLGPALR